jgi:hypothetical protein
VIPPEVRELAETPDRYTAVTPGFTERLERGRFVIMQAPHWAAVSGVETDDVEGTVAETRQLTAGRSTIWWLGPSTRPVDLEERLRAMGFRDPPDRAVDLVAMATVVPPDAPEGVDVRRVETLDDYARAAELRWDAFGVPEHRREEERGGLEDAYRRTVEAGSVVYYVAYVDGRPAATGACVVSPRGLLLFGGATAAWARGRGLYRALVRARWDEAVARGTPALVVEADPRTSEPILRSLGFVEVCRLRRLEDPG